MKTDQPIIDIDDEIRSDDRRPEIPTFTIEDNNDNSPLKDSFSPLQEKKTGQRARSHKGLIIALIVLTSFLLAAILIAATVFFTEKPEVASSVSDKQNIEILKASIPERADGTTVTSDSIFGVAFDMFSLDGLTASLEREMPDTTDSSLVLFMRSADYHPDGSMLGTVVINGKEMPAKEPRKRPSYLAISKDGGIAIGISLSDKVADFVKNNDGSFFRQYTLLGDGELPTDFMLHGKVERAGIGRMADGKMYYVVSKHKETMYDFADALREYGFVDAIYITGGNAYTFHRSSDGNIHIPEETKAKLVKYNTTAPPAPILVFRKSSAK